MLTMACDHGSTHGIAVVPSVRCDARKELVDARTARPRLVNLPHVHVEVARYVRSRYGVEADGVELPVRDEHGRAREAAALESQMADLLVIRGAARMAPTVLAVHRVKAPTLLWPGPPRGEPEVEGYPVRHVRHRCILSSETSGFAALRRTDLPLSALALHRMSLVLRTFALPGVALLLCACSPDKGFGEAKEISADNYGPAWPLTVSTAQLNKVCGEGDTAVGLIVDGQEFVIDDLDGPADASKAFLRYWAEDASRPSGRMDLSPLAADGRALCD